MKKILLVLSAIALLAGCYKGDINDLKDDVSKLKERMAQYENLLDVLNKRLYVVSYETKDNSYIITMSDGSKLSVRNTSSFITIGDNGNWWIDGVDTGKSAKGEPGSKGEAPEIKIGTNGNWFINGVDTGISAKGQAGKDASDIISISMVEGNMSFTFADGRTISIQASAPDIAITEPSGGFVINKMQWLRIQPQVNNTSGASYKWMLNGEEIDTAKNLLSVFATDGTYNLEFKATNGVGTNSKTITVIVNNKTYVNNTNKVFEYFPAPGQFINTMPAATATDNDETMRQKAETALTTGSMICLGGFGGYVVMGFDHTIINKTGNDFTVLGNAFADWAEPGVIMVSYDANGNGQPDDEWYEIAGSEYNKSTTIKNYELTYYKPGSEPSNKNEPNYIRWTDNKGQSGYISKNSFHAQTYYPVWKGESITLKGTFMASGIYDKSGTGTNWANSAYDWGYADNWANSDVKAQINIDWAVDKNGKAVHLKGVDFIKVHTGNRAEGGWLGEVSTEVSGIKDLNF